MFSRNWSSSYHVNKTESHAPDASDASNHVDDSTSGSIITINSIKNVPPITYKVEVNGLPITMELDSGVCSSLLNSDHWKLLGQPDLKKRPVLRDISRNANFVLNITYVEIQLKEQKNTNGYAWSLLTDLTQRPCLVENGLQNSIFTLFSNLHLK